MPQYFYHKVVIILIISPSFPFFKNLLFKVVDYLTKECWKQLFTLTLGYLQLLYLLEVSQLYQGLASIKNVWKIMRNLKNCKGGPRRGFVWCGIKPFCLRDLGLVKNFVGYEIQNEVTSFWMRDRPENNCGLLEMTWFSCRIWDPYPPSGAVKGRCITYWKVLTY